MYSCLPSRSKLRHPDFRILGALPLLLLLLVQLPPAALGHSRWRCPPPRSPDTGIKLGPCGFETGDFSTGGNGDDSAGILELRPGPLLVSFEESIYHTGAPFRISLSSDGVDDDACVLLDHVPHNDLGNPNFGNELTWTQYSVVVEIPDVNCDRCSLHLANPMTDKIGFDGSPDGVGCTDPGTCFSVYHSCTLPFRIVGSSSDSPRRSGGDWICPNILAANGWPTTWKGDSDREVDVSVPGVYRREAGEWSTDGLLLDVPERFRIGVDACAATTATVLEDVAESASPTSTPEATVVAETAPPTGTPAATKTDPPTFTPDDGAATATASPTSTPQADMDETSRPPASSSIDTATAPPTTTLSVEEQEGVEAAINSSKGSSAANGTEKSSIAAMILFSSAVGAILAWT